MATPYRNHFLILFSAILFFPSLAKADGGALRLSQQQDGYRIAVFTTPTPLRAGPVDFSVLIQDAATGELATEVEVNIKVQRQGDAETLDRPATAEAATNKLYYATTFDLPEPGLYTVEVSVIGAPGTTQVHFDVEAAEPLPQMITVLPWVGWPLLAIVLFSVHQVLVRWRNPASSANQE